MNRSRVIVLVAAVFAAGLAALLARSLLGGGTEKSKAEVAPPPIATAEVLVAATAIQAGTQLTPTSVRWQKWPKTALDDTLITRDMAPSLKDAVAGTVARTTILAGEPLTGQKIVHADSASFMSAQLTPGMRAVSIGISPESTAGGFILPNDRVDILMTAAVAGVQHTSATRVLLHDVRVLAIGQTYTESKDQKVLLGKTATLELTPRQAQVVQRGAADGSLSLILRPLGDSGANRTVASTSARANAEDRDDSTDMGVSVIRYGIAHAGPNANSNQAGE